MDKKYKHLVGKSLQTQNKLSHKLAKITAKEKILNQVISKKFA